MTSLRIARIVGLPLAAIAMLTATAFAQQPMGKSQNPKAPVVGGVGQGAANGMAPKAPLNPDGPIPPRAPAAPSGYAGVPTTGLCAQGFAKTSEHKITAPHSNHQQAYSSYTCESVAPTCPEQKIAAEKGPKLEAVTRQGGGGTDVSGPFTIRVDYKVAYDYHCSTPPLTCLSKVTNVNAHSVNVEVKQGVGIGNKIGYKCTYYWLNG